MQNNTNKGFEEGSVVRLKSGGPNMTVSKIAKPSQSSALTPSVLTCQWFNNDEIKESYFTAAVLEDATNSSEQLTG
jgi:uncharacterized protein YodC (DUF2158 family)